MRDGSSWKNGTGPGGFVIPDGYAEHAPPPDLARYVACFWTRIGADSRAPAGPRRVLPDGCVDILLAFASSADARSRVDATIVGTMTRALVVDRVDAFAFYGVRFRPGWALIALGIPAFDVTDLAVPLGDLPGAHTARVDALGDPGTPHQARLAGLVSLVRTLFATAPSTPPAAVLESVRRIAAARGNLRVADLATTIGITRQRLAREFAMHVGITPKAFARVMRLQAAVARADAARAAFPRPPDWSAIAYELGYYDQPHFIDDFKALAGVTPGEYVGAIAAPSQSG